MRNNRAYAIKHDSDVFHVMDLRTSVTLCGLEVVNLNSRSGTLTVTLDKPPHGRLCRHCDDALDVLHRSN